MAQIPVVFGEWLIRNGAWHFAIDGRKGGRLFFLRNGCTYAELVEMALDDYLIDKEPEMLQFSYPLTEMMLQQFPQDTPPVYVTNDRSVQNLIEFSSRNVVRLCISTRCMDRQAVNDGDVDINNPRSVSDVDPTDDVDNDVDPGDEECAEPAHDTDHADDKPKDVDDMDFDYSEYGKFKDEDEDGDGDDGEEGKPFFGAIHGQLNNPWIDQLKVGQCFQRKDDVVSEVRLTAVMLKFSFKVWKSTKSRLVVICSVPRCTWRVVATVKHDTNSFWVTKYVNVHTCSIVDRVANRKHCTPRYIGRLFVDRVGIIEGVAPHHIQDAMRTMFGMTMDYTTSYRALQFAQEYVRGSAESGYANLPSCLRQIELSNPGSVVDLVVDEDNKFKYLFFSFAASIRGFKFVRRVIVVDGTHLTGKYEGVMLVAAAQDGNFQIFPLAFAIVDSECDASWEWFFTKLSSCISDEYPLVIVSDRHSSIAKACRNVIPWATRGICYYHLQQNIISNFSGKQLMYLVKGAAYAHTHDDYNRYMNSLVTANPALAAYLNEADPALWSRVYCPGDRYNIKTSNIAESINSMLKKAKGYPIAYLIEYITKKLGRWYWKRREDALNLTTEFSRGVENLLAVREYYADMMTVERIDGWRFNVRGGQRECIVDLEGKTCSCGVFNVEKIPCSHAIKAVKSSGWHMAAVVDHSYTKNYLYSSYAANIMPNVQSGDPIVPEIVCLPPVPRRRPGRQKKSRWLTWLELSRKRGSKPSKSRKSHKPYTCSKCRQPGHTRPHCLSNIHLIIPSSIVARIVITITYLFRLLKTAEEVNKLITT